MVCHKRRKRVTLEKALIDHKLRPPSDKDYDADDHFTAGYNAALQVKEAKSEYPLDPRPEAPYKGTCGRRRDTGTVAGRARVRLPGEKLGPKHCALCARFFVTGRPDLSCRGCPVHARTGKLACDGILAAYERHGFSSPEFQSATKAELDFLLSLQPTPP